MTDATQPKLDVDVNVNDNTNRKNGNNDNDLNGNKKHLKPLSTSKNCKKNASTLSANAVPFDVSASPTINPYGGQYGIQTQGVYVPPAPIPPAAVATSTRRRTTNDTSTNGKQQQHQHNNATATATARSMRHRQQQQQSQQYLSPHQQHQHQNNYNQINLNEQWQNRPNHKTNSNNSNNPTSSNNSNNSNNSNSNVNNANNNARCVNGANGTNNVNNANNPHQQINRHRNGYPPMYNKNNGNTSGTATTATSTATTTTNTQHITKNVSKNVSKNVVQKVSIATYTTHPFAQAVGNTISYKPHPSRNNYGQPDPKHRDPKFTNSPELQSVQRWELLESAKRWLPGEGTLITWKNYRYLIGAPIHMGMNGHIHYCYKYPIPTTTTTKDNDDNDDNDNDDDDDNDNDNDDNDDNKPLVETLAAKIVPNTPAFAREIVILRALQNCENITSLYNVLESSRTLISILELAQADVYNFFVGRGSSRHGWNLDKPAVREHFSKMVISNVVQGLEQMHTTGYLHCDLKSLNILLYIYVTQNSNKKGGVYIKAKLTDFGHSSHGNIRIAEKLFSNGMARVGTAGHVAPELFREGSKCNYKIDIWSLGIVMFSMLIPGKLLFGEYTNLDNLRLHYDKLNKMNPWSRDRPIWWTDFERLSPEARDLILWMTRYDYRMRPSSKDILSHPWFLIGKQGYRKNYRPKLKYVDMICSSSIAQE